MREEDCRGMPRRVAMSFARAGEDSRRDGCMRATGGAWAEEEVTGGEAMGVEGSGDGMSASWESCMAFAMVCLERMISAS